MPIPPVVATDVESEFPASRVRQTPKSIATHQRIIEAAIRCFLEIGYHRTTTSEIAKQARVTRGAVQYYFPTTPEVLRATVDHITQRFTAEYLAATANVAHEGGEGLDQGIEALWHAAHSPFWTAWKELEAAARTDTELASIMGPAKATFAARWEQTAKDVYGSFLEADPVKFEMGRHLAWQFLQALAGSSFAPLEEDAVVKARLLTEFKRLIRQYWGMVG
ncbi:TetR/AcrR family transcriptional regulator [Niveispirillum sp. KHB5.9]|uniref:TetR/AcrR family transcriptional regulator n=1 Tax=Niveispirillum sp. KHB5.9 TaxID=3400269 RepID=UPI003A892BDA